MLVAVTVLEQVAGRFAEELVFGFVALLRPLVPRGRQWHFEHSRPDLGERLVRMLKVESVQVE